MKVDKFTIVLVAIDLLILIGAYYVSVPTKSS